MQMHLVYHNLGLIYAYQYISYNTYISININIYMDYKLTSVWVSVKTKSTFGSLWLRKG